MCAAGLRKADGQAPFQVLTKQKKNINIKQHITRVNSSPIRFFRTRVAINFWQTKIYTTKYNNKFLNKLQEEEGEFRVLVCVSVCDS